MINYERIIAEKNISKENQFKISNITTIDSNLTEEHILYIYINIMK